VGAISNNRTCQPFRHEGEGLHQSSLQIKVIDGARVDWFSWGKRSGRGRAACSGSRRAQRKTPGGSRGTSDRPHRLRVVSFVQLFRVLVGSLTVVALLALGAVTAHVTEATAGVASGLAGTTVSALTTTVTATATEAATVGATTLRAVAGNVTLLAALVALLTAGATTTGSTTSLGALTADVAGTTAAVAGLLSLGRGALAANVALLAAVVAGRGTLGRALSSAVGVVAA
jgi:hypothetical protein